MAFLLSVAFAAIAVAVSSPRPNVVIFFGDDWGYGDMGANWNPTKGFTPNLDALAAGGLRFLDFHVAASVCTPSRAALLTGRLGLRTGVTHNFGPESAGGLPLGETTIAEYLRPAGYRTGMIGKWHLGSANGHHPIDRGFDFYVGVPYSVDMGCGATPTITFAPTPAYNSSLCPACPLSGQPMPDLPPETSCHRKCGCIMNLGVPIFYNKTIKEQPVDLGTVSDQYGAAAEDFIETADASGSPFLLYYAASHMHVPLNSAERWNKPGRSAFQSGLLEMDNEVGRVVAAVNKTGNRDKTLILVTGDNGPWECKCGLAGSKGPFEGLWMKNQPGGGSAAKMTLWEGGHRVVGLAHWPGTIAPGVSGALASSLDYIPTVLSFAGVALPTDRSFDGIDLTALLISPDSQRNNASAHSTLFHPLSGACGSGDLMAARVGRYKAHWITGGANGCMGSTTPACITHSPPLLFDVGGEDPAEAHALDTALPQYAVVVKQLEDARIAKLANIASTLRHVANYSTSAAGRAANCCNKKSPDCACSGNNNLAFA